MRQGDVGGRKEERKNERMRQGDVGKRKRGRMRQGDVGGRKGREGRMKE